MICTKISKLFILSLILSSSALYAQFGSAGDTDARSTGMAETYNSTVNGIYAVGINPARLSFDNSSLLEISTLLPLPNISLRTGTSFISMDEINYYFGGENGEARFLTEQDKDKLNTLFENGGSAIANGSARLFSAGLYLNKSAGAIAFSVCDVTAARVNLPAAFFDIALSGNPVGRTFNLDDADLKGWWIRNYALSYSREIQELSIFDNFSAGITLKLIHGYYYAGTHKNSTAFTTLTNSEISGHTEVLGYSSFSDNFGVTYDFDSTSGNSDFSLFPSPAGKGFGFDIGFAASPDEKWTLALALTDVGSIKWTNNVAEFRSSGNIFIDDLASEEQRDSAKEMITGDSRRVDFINTGLATVLRLGVSYIFAKDNKTWPGSLLLGFDYNQGFNDMPGNSVVPRFSIGAEWKPMDWVPFLRTGFSYGGELGFNWAFGLGIDAGILDLNFATNDMQSVFSPNSSRALSVSLSSRWKF